MARKKSKEQIKYNMSRVRNSDTALEHILCEKLRLCGITTFKRNDKAVFGKPDISFPARKIAIFCDGDFWHGYNWETAKDEIKSNQDFWFPKIERNMQRDAEVTERLRNDGWMVLRFWGHEIQKEPECSTETISEKSPDQLLPGDVLVFLRRDDYTQNIVDYIFEKLLRGGRLGSDAVDAYEKSQYWKEALREYKEINNLTYRKVAKGLRNVGCSVQEVTVRQWLIDGSHIVGPRKETTLEQIAMLTKDTFLLQNTHAYFEACGIVRHDRRKILDFIAKAINDKLSGKTPVGGSVLSVVYENVDRLSETLELENITELDDTVCIGINLVNTPITEAEVSM